LQVMQYRRSMAQVLSSLLTVIAWGGQRRWHNPQRMHFSISMATWPRVLSKGFRGTRGYINVAGPRTRFPEMVLLMRNSDIRY
jgi:hypothetical protein